MKYEITIRQLEEFSSEEKEEVRRQFKNQGIFDGDHKRYSDKNFHETRVLFAEVSKEEFERIKLAIIKEF